LSITFRLRAELIRPQGRHTWRVDQTKTVYDKRGGEALPVVTGPGETAVSALGDASCRLQLGTDHCAKDPLDGKMIELGMQRPAAPCVVFGLPATPA